MVLRRAPYLLIILDVLVSHSHEQLPEVLPLVVLPPLHVGFQVSIEALHPILTFLNVHGHLKGDAEVGVTGLSCPKLLCSHSCEGPNHYMKMP